MLGLGFSAKLHIVEFSTFFSFFISIDFVFSTIFQAISIDPFLLEKKIVMIISVNFLSVACMSDYELDRHYFA
jgi:hypothetical protein